MASDIQMMMFPIPKDMNLIRTFYQMSMPTKWDKIFRDIWPNEGERPKIPYASLGDALRLLFPEIVHIEKMWSTDITRNGWLFSWELPRDEPFMALMQMWGRMEGERQNREIQSFIEQLDRGDLDWNKQELRLDEYDTHDNGTPDLGSVPFRCGLLLDWVCTELAGKEIRVGDQSSLEFRRAYDGRRPHLISWPAIENSRRGSLWYWSYVLTPSIQTMPGYPEPLLLFAASIRRWASDSLVRESGYYDLPPGKTSVYVEVPDSWFTDLPGERDHSFALLPMELAKIERDGRDVWEPVWANFVDQILSRLGTEPTLPNAVELLEDPPRFLKREYGSAGLLIRNSNTHHPVTGGVPLTDRRDIFRSVSKLLKPYGFSPIEVSERVRPRVPRKRSSLRAVPYSAMQGREIIQSLRHTVGDRIQFEVLYQTEATRTALRTEIWKRLLKGIPDETPASDKITVEGVHIEITFRQLGAVGSELDRDGRGGEDRRVSQIKEAFHKSDNPIGCIVELHDREHFKSKRDPKAAIRWGLATRGRLSQFMTPLPIDDNVPDDGIERVSNAVADMLRQFGNMPGSPFDKMPDRFPSNVQALAIWVHPRNRLPMLVHLASRSQVAKNVSPIRVMLPTGIRGGCWYSYPEAQLKIGSDEISKIHEDKIRGILKKMLGEFAESSVVDDSPLLMLCDAENMRGRWIWPELQNQKLVVGQPDGMPWNTAGLKPRLARIRTGNNGEVPQWFEDSLTWSSGLFEAPGRRAYFGIGSKSVTMKSSSQKESKRDRPFGRHALSRVNEIILVQLHEGDDCTFWAGAVHRLREMASHFNDVLSLPLPLHLAKKTEEYIPKWRSRRRL